MENKNFWKNFTENKKLFWGVVSGAAALLVIVGVVLALTLGGSAEMNGCTVTVKTEGGMALEGVGVYIYEKADKKEMVSFAKTDADGKVAFAEAIPTGSVIVLENVPAGYAVAENYAVKEATEIVLASELLKEMSAITLGSIMFDFTVQDTEGTEYTLSQLLKEKKAVVLNLWYTNCDPCKAEFPFLQQAYEKYSDNIALLALNPVAEDDNAAISAFKAANGLTFPMAKVDAKWAEQIKNIAYPTTVVIDRYGMAALLHTGGIDNAKTFEDTFAYFAAEDYAQAVVSDIKSLATKDESADQNGNDETTAPPETTDSTEPPATSDATEPPATTKPSKPSGGSSSSSNPGNSSGNASGGNTNTAPNYNGTLVNSVPIEVSGTLKFQAEDIGAGEMKLYQVYRVTGTTLKIADADAYVVYKNKTYKPENGVVSISIKDDSTFMPIELKIGNSGSSAKTFSVSFNFPAGSRENPKSYNVGKTVKVEIKKGNDQGVYYTYKASADGVLTINVLSKTADCDILITNKEIDTGTKQAVLSAIEGATSVQMEVKAGEEVLIQFVSIPDKNYNYPAATIEISSTLT